MPNRYIVILTLLAAGFVWLTGSGLPPVVASQFDAAGVPSRTMERSVYIGSMLALVVGLPLLITVLPSLALRNPRMTFNLPHRQYWLAPERRQESVDFLCRHMARLGLLVIALLCYVHWLVVLANALEPPKLASTPFITALVLFVTASIAWTAALLMRFARVPPERA